MGGQVEVALRADGRFGMVDPMIWPQVFSPLHPHLCAIRKVVAADISKSIAWWSPEEAEFSPLEEGGQWGTLTGPVFVLIAWANKTAEALKDYETEHSDDKNAAFIRLKLSDLIARLSFPSTFRDLVRQVAAVQRASLEGEAYLRFYEDALPLLKKAPVPLSLHNIRPADGDLIGTFTQDPNVALRLYMMGLPVWFVLKKQQVPSGVEAKVGKMLTEDELARPPPGTVVENRGPFNTLRCARGQGGRASLIFGRSAAEPT